MSNYQILSQDEQDEILAQHLHATERDHYCHTINKERYEGILETVEDGPFKERIQGLHKETCERLVEVSAIRDGLVKQCPDAARVESAVARCAERASKVS